ncbi:MAG: formate dehydrogenase accessory sulfurtransferase FdhD [Bryobacteraceae bacterium]
MAGTGAREISVYRVNAAGGSRQQPDYVAVEEPLDIQIGFSDGARQSRTVSITMRTPGEDRELAAGFLFTEGILRAPSQVAAVLAGRNSVRVELQPDVIVDWPSIERHVYTSSSCGVCGKTSIDAVRAQCGATVGEGFRVRAEVIAKLPALLRSSQPAFEATGGLHAAALFNPNGELLDVREDVGRHNALDKLIGARFLEDQLPLGNCIVMVSGRASFELVQKAATAGVPVLAAVGAPSSLAVELAYDSGMTLAGFVREGGFNVYSGAYRILDDSKI